MERMLQGLSALLLSLRRRPVIRYQSGSDIAARLALALYHLIYHEAQSSDTLNDDAGVGTTAF